MQKPTSISDTSDSEIHITYPIKPGTSIVTKQTQLQHYSFAETIGFGTSLFIDGRIQSTQKDEYIYHEMLVHSLLFSLECRESVLILGGAEGCVAREVLKWKDVKKVVQIDWDEELVNEFRNKYSSWNDNVYSNDSRLSVFHMDAMDYFKTYVTKFDAIIIDLLDPSEETMPFIKPLLRECKSHLKEGGGYIINGGSVLPYKKTHAVELMDFMKSISNRRSSGFALQIYVPSFIQHWCLLVYISNDWADSILQNRSVPFETRTFNLYSFLTAMRWSKEYNGAMDTWSKIEGNWMPVKV
jgi:spermidine synthase